jgi:hypothetical protein
MEEWKDGRIAPQLRNLNPQSAIRDLLHTQSSNLPVFHDEHDDEDDLAAVPKGQEMMRAPPNPEP